MNFHGRAVLVYLEEDNIARAYFRIQPLLTQEGIIGEEELKSFPDDGYLRIVPDKNEQHTFKERMRSLCGICMMDLRALPSEANKIRTNKNYSPSQGETNQYIVYSDAVRALPENLMYQVVAENDVQSAVTPWVYIRSGANIQGPFRRDNGQPAGEIVQLPPDSAEIHEVALHFSGSETNILIYWPCPAQPAQQKDTAAEAAAQPAAPQESAPQEAEESAPEKNETNAYAQIQQMNQALSENANRLDAPAALPADLMPVQPQKPLTGTRLYQAPLRSVSPKRAHNPLMEAVEQHRYAAKYEAPGAVLPQNAELKDAANPVASLKRALQSIWNSPEAQQQVVDVLLSQPSMRLCISRAMAKDGRDAVLTAMKSQLQELEAERLMTLMQLDDAKKNLSAFREEALSGITQEQQKKLDDLNQAEKNARAALENAQAALEPVNEQCRQAAEKLASLQKPLGEFSSAARLLCPAQGRDADQKELISRVEKSLTAAGFACQPGDARAMLAAFALSEGKMEMRAETEADALLAYEAFANALGCRIEACQGRRIHILEGGNAPLFIRSLEEETHPLVTGVLTASSRCPAKNAQGGDDLHSLASVTAEPALSALPGPLPQFAPVSKACIIKEMLHETSLSQETAAAVQSLRMALLDAGQALPLVQVRALCRFIACTQSELSGGVSEAIDRAVCIYAVPHILRFGLPVETLRPLLAAFPRTLKALNA